MPFYATNLSGSGGRAVVRDWLDTTILWTDAFADCNYLGLADAQETTVTSTSLRSGKVEAIKIHHLVPRSHEVTHERLLRIVTC
ncbi:MAG: hypothetical protein IIB11_02750, partial [Chloroflexi bacterium]|nr:hypothetical protein [Chloroflexota bacterium]